MPYLDKELNRGCQYIIVHLYFKQTPAINHELVTGTQELQPKQSLT